MNFEFSDTQKQMQQEARRVLSEQSDSAAVRRVMGSASAIDRALWNTLAELGFAGIAIPEAYGGSGAGYLELCVIAEELGRALAPVPFSSSIYLCAELILSAGTEEQKRKYLPKIASGQSIACLAFAEGIGNVVPASIAVQAAGGKLSGSKWPVLDGDCADIAIVVARSAGGEQADGISLYIADLQGSGVKRTSLESIDPSRGQARIDFSAAAGELLGPQGGGWPLFQNALDRAAVLTAFEQVGGADRALEMARDYAQERYAFGRPIGSFQAIKHKLVDLYVSNVLARSNCYFGAWALATGSDELPQAAAAARVGATLAYQAAAKENIQVHGGMGFTWEMDCHLLYRRAALLAVSLGGLSSWQEKLVQALQRERAARMAEEARPAAAPLPPAGESQGDGGMDFGDTPEEAAFRKEARAWLDANAPHHLREELAAEVGHSTSSVNPPQLHSIDTYEASKQWQAKLYEGGWSGMQWPREYGGRGASAIQRVIWQQEAGLYAQLSNVFTVGLGMAAPTIMQHGTEAQKKRYLQPIAAGKELWCQLFSEPSGGSDLAGLRTRARREGDDWIVNGSKIWTTHAQKADFGIMVLRTDPEVPKHEGLTVFLVDMKSPGITVRPIKQMNGEARFNEVFFEDVRIPDSMRVGPVGGGWKVALTTLLNERLSLAAAIPTGVPEFFEFVCELRTPEGLAIDDAAVRARVANWMVRARGLRFAMMRTISALSSGKPPGPENSIGKLVAGEIVQDLASLALDLQGPAGALMDVGDSRRSFQKMLLSAPEIRVGGGTAEIQRNILAEQVLGLPPDVRADKGIPFNKIPTGKH